MIALIKGNDWSNFTVILKNSFGRLIGSVLALAFAGYCIFSMCIGLRTFIEVMKMFLLEKTPTEFLIVVSVLCGVYIIRGGIGTLVKFNEIAFWLTFIPVAFILLLLLSNADFTNIFPIAANEPINYIKSLPADIYIFKGFEIVFLFLPLIKYRENSVKVSALSIIFITVFYVVIFVFTLAVLSKYLNNIFLWPTITMIKAINIPGTFIESWDGVVMTLWILFYFTTFINSFYFASDIVKNAFNFSSIKLSYIFVLPFLYLGSLFPENILELNNLRGTPFQIYTVLMIIALPVLALIMSSTRNKKAVVSLLLVCVLFTGCWDKVDIDNRSFITTIGIDAGEDIGNQ
jgi:spore germination protein (amino acid permease)